MYVCTTDVSTHPLDTGVNIHAANNKTDSFNLACTISSIVWSSSKARMLAGYSLSIKYKRIMKKF